MRCWRWCGSVRRRGGDASGCGGLPRWSDGASGWHTHARYAKRCVGWLLASFVALPPVRTGGQCAGDHGAGASRDGCRAAIRMVARIASSPASLRPRPNKLAALPGSLPRILAMIRHGRSSAAAALPARQTGESKNYRILQRMTIGRGEPNLGVAYRILKNPYGDCLPTPDPIASRKIKARATIGGTS